MNLDDLIHQVEEAALTEEPLDRVAAAMGVKADLDDLTDSVIGHFVDQARRAGCSWSEIGSAMGVSKQAAQQRHTTERPKRTRLRGFGRFTDRAKRCVREASNAAAELGHGYIGTEHLLLGILDSPRCLAARVLKDAGYGREQVLASMGATEPKGPSPRRRHLPFTPLANDAMEQTLANALHLGHNYIGTEHMLLALFDVEEGLAAKSMTSAGLTKDGIQAAVVKILAAA